MGVGRGWEVRGKLGPEELVLGMISGSGSLGGSEDYSVQDVPIVAVVRRRRKKWVKKGAYQLQRNNSSMLSSGTQIRPTFGRHASANMNL